MIKHIFKTSIRHLWKNKVFSLINLLGLTIGLVSSFCIATYLYHENTYDITHPDGAYRIIASESWNRNNDKNLSANTFLRVTRFIEQDIPEITQIARVKPVETATLRVRNEVFIEKAFIWADASLLKLLDIHFLQGTSGQALETPGSVIITQQEASRLFGTSNPMGQVITVNDHDLTVTGIVADMPSNMHLKKKLIGSLNTFKDLSDPWSNQGYIYLNLIDKADPIKVSEKINAAMAGNIRWTTKPPTYQLQPVKDIHLHSNNIIGSPDATDINYLYIFGLIGAVLVFATSFNYISLSITDFTARAKDFGLKKILGSGTRHLIFQPAMECLLLCGIAALMAILITLLSLPAVNRLMGSEINQAFFLSLPNLILLLSVLFLVIVMSAIYPIMLFIRFRPVNTIRKNHTVCGTGISIRRPLMVMQFVIAMVLVISVIIIQQQMKYLSSGRLGFNKEQVLVLKTPRFSEINAPLMKQQLEQLAAVRSASICIGTPFEGGFSHLEQKGGLSYNLSEFFVDTDYIQTLGIDLLAGRDFLPTDSNKVIVNETMVRTMGWDNPIGQETSLFGDPKEVLAVVRDFQLNNIHTAIHPIVMGLGNAYASNILVSLKTDNLVQNLLSIESIWKETLPEHPLEYAFLDEQFEQLFHTEIQFQRLSKVLSFIAILIACLGLFGAIVYTAQQRVKEIGIRKVLGASVTGIVQLLSKDFIWLVFFALLIASPIAWWAMNSWLQDFAYRIEIQWWVFAAAGLATVVIALATVSFQAVKAAVANPVKSLRTE